MDPLEKRFEIEILDWLSNQMREIQNEEEIQLGTSQSDNNDRSSYMSVDQDCSYYLNVN